MNIFYSSKYFSF